MTPACPAPSEEHRTEFTPLRRFRQVRVDAGSRGVEVFSVYWRPAVQMATAKLAEVSQVVCLPLFAFVLKLCLLNKRALASEYMHSAAVSPELV